MTIGMPTQTETDWLMLGDKEQARTTAKGMRLHCMVINRICALAADGCSVL